jgi:hypothetical protein
LTKADHEAKSDMAFCNSFKDMGEQFTPSIKVDLANSNPRPLGERMDL